MRTQLNLHLIRATKALQQVLYIDPGFSRKNEVHIRLAIMFKNKNDFNAALKVLYRVILPDIILIFQFFIQFYTVHLSYEIIIMCCQLM